MFRRSLVLMFAAISAPAMHVGAQSPPPASAVVAPSAATPAPAVAAAAWLLIDVTSGQTLTAVNADERRDPASLTKLMTAYLVFGALRAKTIVPSQMVNVSERAWRAEGSRMFIQPRRAVSVDELLRGMIVQSGNDASVALAELVGGTEEAFVARMNAEAARLGMPNTRFTNVTGLSGPAALFDGRRHGEARGRGDPRLSRVLPALFAEGIPLQQHHAAQPQSPAVDRSLRGRDEDRPHRRGRLVSRRVGAARATAACWPSCSARTRTPPARRKRKSC